MHALRMALLGYGRFGRVHALRARTHGAFELACVVDPDPHARQAAQADGLLAVASLQDLPPGIDVATVATPAPAHAAMAMALMHRGIHVLVEKPFAPSLDEIEAMLATQCSTNRLLCTAHIERFNACLHKDAWPVRPLHLRFERACHAQASAEALVMDLMVHDLDLAAHLLGLPHQASCEVLSVHVQPRSVAVQLALDGQAIQLRAIHSAPRSRARLAWRSDHRQDRVLDLSSPSPPGSTDALTRQYSAWQRALQGQATDLASAMDGAVAARRALAIAARL
ncbi:hypothetical protein CCO03_17305 [Comamonas serinivorans]|uniref:Gfo/Idh/MocA-like oxidoreductase N-terminal domain-containing protein n=1 Tax=Comamonas serinivorans TaxID=1082851 RepID=A0A1Y0ERB3_9BURK|nr:Gfo/Idh/MocA family oxidoreductase [Comamonas serinivorans]ARU06197.1 hypothetical protein CCO03_17305 [Comamonas serinivorans]